MSTCLLDVLEVEVEAFFRAARILIKDPSPENLTEARRTLVRYREAENRDYKALLDRREWTQEEFDCIMKQADLCGKAHEAWLDSVEEDLKKGVQERVEVFTSTANIDSIGPTLVLTQPQKRKDRTFF